MAVVVLHYNNNSIGGGFSLVPPGSINEKCMFLIENFFIGAVDLFVLISAYFLKSFVLSFSAVVIVHIPSYHFFSFTTSINTTLENISVVNLLFLITNIL